MTQGEGEDEDVEVRKLQMIEWVRSWFSGSSIERMCFRFSSSMLTEEDIGTCFFIAFLRDYLHGEGET